MEKAKVTKLLEDYEYVISLLADLRDLKTTDGLMIREVLEDYSQQDLEKVRNECSRVRRMALRIFKARKPKQEKVK